MTDTSENGQAHQILAQATARLQAAMIALEEQMAENYQALLDAQSAQELAQQKVANQEDLIAELTAKLKNQEDLLTSAKAGLSDKSELKARVAKLETENLALHEQVASAALTGPEGDAELRAALASLKAEKKMLEDRYASLKKEFAAGGNTESSGEIADLRDKIARFERERDDMRSTLDVGIARLEGVLRAGEG